MFNIFNCLFIIAVNSAPYYLQLELIDLQSNSELKFRFENKNKVDLYAKCISKDKYPDLEKNSFLINFLTK